LQHRLAHAGQRAGNRGRAAQHGLDLNEAERLGRVEARHDDDVEIREECRHLLRTENAEKRPAIALLLERRP
jgi:hypothetical protein